MCIRDRYQRRVHGIIIMNICVEMKQTEIIHVEGYPQVEKNPVQANPQYPKSSLTSSEKKDFVAKVYGILIFQLAITYSIVFYSSINPSFGNFCSHSATCTVCGLIVGLCLWATSHIRNLVPENYVALFFFTVAASVLVSALTSQVDPNVVFKLSLLSLGVT
eukprot:TRINITY_DN9248_c0_g1_i1.p1 TRINITY_DN9248_c0_g1~~TRINITY_DN9248_c0_g1_i1.p1  ORF type:complete len:170 (+),score=27.32 TRINITY_DN9248_c0_g1_i1:26-511(+)